MGFLEAFFIKLYSWHYQSQNDKTVHSIFVEISMLNFEIGKIQVQKSWHTSKLLYHSPIAQWLIYGIKTFPKIFLFSSKIILLIPNIYIYFWKLTKKNSINSFGFFIGIFTSKQIVPASFLSFQLRTSIQKYVKISR